jgi:undecaprenyl-diphosphatase
LTVWAAIILGIVQGLTEFLPISSSGHLVIAEELLHANLQGIGFEVAVHIATLISVFLMYRQRIWKVASGALHGDRQALRFIGLVILASVPAAVVGVVFKDAIDEMFDDPSTIAIQLIINGFILWSTRWALRRREMKDPVTAKSAWWMGVAQAFAIIPAISRSGTTVGTAMWMGVDVVEAAAFSFLMSIPAIAGAAVLQIPDLIEQGPGMPIPSLIAAMLAAAITGVLSIWTFIKVVEKGAFHRFAPYCWALGVFFALWLHFR